MPSTVMIPVGERQFRPFGTPRSRGSPEALFNFTNRLSSKKTLTSFSVLMKVKDEAKNRVKSNARGMGAGSLSTIPKLVHALDFESSSSLGKRPRRANN